jgi:glutamine amidotransferase
MRYDLIEHIRPDVAQRIAGTTDSEWIYAMVLSQLEDPYGEPDARELADAVTATLRRLREVRARHGIDISSPVNLFLATGRSLVATRFSFDYGWYPDEDALLETDLPYCSLWYTVGGTYEPRAGGASSMSAGDALRSVLIASEPLTIDTTSWLELPEYSMITASSGSDGLEFQTLDLDA